MICLLELNDSKDLLFLILQRPNLFARIMGGANGHFYQNLNHWNFLRWYSKQGSLKQFGQL